jgi:type IV pilus assembly protein PilW
MILVKKISSQRMNRKVISKQSILGKQKGLSIIELLVAMAVGLILTLGISQIFASNSETMKIQNELARVQEDSRIAIELLSREIRNADYWGCAGSLSDDLMINHLNPGDPTIYGFGKGIEGRNDVSAATATALGISNVKIGTDIIIYRGSSTFNSLKPTSHNLANANLSVSNDITGTIQSGDLIAISDCGAGDIFQATPNTNANKIGHNTGNGVSPGNRHMGGLFDGCPGNNGHCLSKLYDSSASIMKAYTQMFYIGYGVDGEPSLFMKRDAANGVELIENIDNLQFLYGEDTDSDGKVNVYRNSSNVAEFDNVISVRIGFVFKTNSEIGSKKGKYTVLDKTDFAVNDKYLRRVYVQTVAIRNRI